MHELYTILDNKTLECKEFLWIKLTIPEICEPLEEQVEEIKNQSQSSHI